MKCADPSTTSSRGLFAEIVRLQQAGRRAVLATPLWYRGSVPLTRLSKLLLRDDGSTQGTIGGGPLEATVLGVAAQVVRQDKARVLEFDLTADEAAESGMICGGRCAILLEPIAPDRASEIYAAAARAEQTGDPVVLMTLLSPEGVSQKMAFTCHGDLLGTTGDPSLDDTLRGLAEQTRAEEKPRFVKDPIPAHIDPILPQPFLFIFGAGHIAVPVAHMANLVGFRVLVIDDRADFANRRRFPTAEQVVICSVEEAFPQLSPDEHSYIVAVTRGHAMDEEVVAQALRTRARYIGMIGSRRKVRAVLDRLRARGFSEGDLDRLHAPIGLDIGGATVEEIAVSIVAQLIAVRRKES